MAMDSKVITFLATMVMYLLALNVLIMEGEGAAKYGKTPIGSTTASLSPCLDSTRNVRAKVPPTCCTNVGAFLSTSPKCICSVPWTPLAKQAKINIAIALMIPNLFRS